MSINDVYKAIDYYISQSQNYSTLVISTIAVLISLAALGISLYVFKKQHKEAVYTYLAQVWNDILDLCHQSPLYLDIIKTEHYRRLMSEDERHRYDVYCYKVWGHVEDIVTKGFQNDPQFEPIIHWVTSYHFNWLQRNPTFFTIDQFWKLVGDVRKEPHLIFRYRKLPAKGDDIDWDVVAEDYHNYILGPFAPEMVAPDKEGKFRNTVLNYLHSIPGEDLQQLEIADFGCGPGNLIPHLARKVVKLTGIDKSNRALEIAAKLAKEHGIEFMSHCVDFRKLDLKERYDLVVCVNSILPESRQDVLRILKVIRQHLKPSGKLVAILPSYDTTKYLRSLWHDHYATVLNNKIHAERIIAALKITKKADDVNHAYADDGNIVQCYHTPESIKQEFAAAGLKLIVGPEKVYYPWELTKRFDYGYFPNAKEEIWDWYVVAERTAIA